MSAARRALLQQRQESDEQRAAAQVAFVLDRRPSLPLGPTRQSFSTTRSRRSHGHSLIGARQRGPGVSRRVLAEAIGNSLVRWIGRDASAAPGSRADQPSEKDR